MRLLLDTHIFLWFISGDKQLSDVIRDSIQNPDNEVYLSVASVWEAIIKFQLGKLPLPESPETYLPRQRENHRISSLGIVEESVSLLVTLPSIHRDPFDRILICQALYHNMTIVTADATIRSYPIGIFSSSS